MENLLLPIRVSMRHNCHDRFEPMIKHRKNPVFRDEKPWENRVAWPTILYIEELKIFRMWYLSISEGKADEENPLVIDNAIQTNDKFYICLAESYDGIEWRRPEINLIKSDIYPGNNILIENKGKYLDGPSVVFDPYDVPQRKYKMAYYEQDGDSMGVRTMVSGDGMHWSEIGEFPVLPSQDALKFYHDREKNRYYMLLKDRISNRRSRLVSESIDFVNWSEPKEAISPGFGDDDSTNFYDMVAFKEEDALLGLLTVFDASTQISHSELIYSQSGMAFKRFSTRPAVLKPGDLGTWDGGGIYTTGCGPFEYKRKMRYYYYGSSRRHDNYIFADKYEKTMPEGTPLSGFGIAEYDRGRICGQQFLGEGWLETTALKVTGNKLFINAVVPENIKVSITGCGYSSSIKGFETQNCLDISGDSRNIQVKWKSSRDLSSLMGRYVRVRIEGENAIVYGIRFE